MSLMTFTKVSFGLMVATLASMLVTVANAASLPDAQTLSESTPQQLLAWIVVVEAGIIVAMAGALVQAYRNRVAALEHQVEACRKCASIIAEAVRTARREGAEQEARSA